MAGVEASTRVRADNSRLNGDLRKSRRMFAKTFRGIGRGVKRALSGALSPLGVGAGALGFAAIGTEVLQFEKALADIQIQGDFSAERMAALRGEIQLLSTANGQGKLSLAQAALGLVSLQGKAGVAAGKVEVLSKAALATSAPVEELAGLIFTLESAFGLADPTRLQLGLDSIVKVGKDASIPLGEMNQVLQSVGVTFAKFSQKSEIGTAKLAASLQVLREKGFGGAAEAGTGLEALLGVLQTRTLEFAKAGIEVKDSSGNYRDLFDILTDIDNAGILQDDALFSKVFGKRKEARKAVEALIANRQRVEELTAAAEKSDVINTDVARRRQLDAFKIQKAFNDMKEAIAVAFTPERIEKFGRVMAKVAGVLEIMVDNAGIFIGLWATFKIGALVSGFSAIAGSSAAMAATSAITAANLGKAGAALAALSAGFAVGSFIDEKLGISDKIADTAIGKKEQARERSGFLKDRAGELDFFSRAGIQGRQLGGEGLDRRERRRARALLSSAREQGVVDEGGNINRKRAFAVAENVSFSATKNRTASEVDTERTRALENAIKFALEQEGKGLLVDVRVSVDEKTGKITAAETSESASRRSTQR